MPDLTITAHLKPPPESIFRIWTDSKAFLNHGKFKPKNAIFDARKDGLFYWVMEWEGKTYTHYGRYLRVERPRLVEMTWVTEETKGKETVLTLELEPEEGGTRFKLTHSGFSNEEMKKAYEDGWKGTLADYDEIK